MFRRTPMLLASLLACSCLAISACDDGKPIEAVTRAKEDPIPARHLPKKQQAPQITWKLPVGWTQVANPPSTGPMSFPREATILAGEGASQIEISVTRLEGMAGGPQANMARWARQIDVDLSKEDAIQPVPRQHTMGLYIFVDLLGRKSDESTQMPLRTIGSMLPTGEWTWFVKSTGPATVMEQHLRDFLAFSDSLGFPGSQMARDAEREAINRPAAPDMADYTPRFVVPQGWSPVPLSPISRSAGVHARFRLGEGDEAATVSVSKLPLRAEQAADLDRYRLENINRWRSAYLGVAPFDALDKVEIKPVEMPGVEETDAEVVDMAADADDPKAQRLVSAYIILGDQVWFLLLRGTGADVAQHKDTFLTQFVQPFRLKRNDEAGG